MGPATVVEAGWSVRERTFSIVRPDAPEGTLSGYQLAVDHRLVDRRRYRLAVRARFFQALSAVGSDVSYPAGEARLRYYGFIALPDSKPIVRSVLAAQLTLGRGGSRMPLDDMFAPGAASEMDYPLRAHRQKNQGILGQAPIGRRLDLLNVELRQRLVDARLFQLGAVAFYDGARLRATAQGDEPVIHDVGLGLRLATRGIIVRVDYGRNVSRDGKNAWTAGLGQVF